MMKSGHLMWSVVPLAAVALTACAGCRSLGSAGSAEHRDAPTSSAGAVATERDIVEFEGREPFQYMAPQTPALPAITAGPVLQREKWALAFFAAGVTEGQVVADIGCGKGRFSFDLARAVGDKGLVYCRDTSTYKLDDFRDRMADEGVSNIDLALSVRGDVAIAAGTVDVALLSDVYVYVLNQPETKGAFLDSIRACLKPGGVVVVVHVRSGHLLDDEKRKHVHQQTIDDFVAHGFEPGRRVVFARVQTSMPGEILEFRRPE
ncbi:MAG: class I SAM-dependent methyltransferase [Phycisphaerales bacterium]